jgi:hypothetical protein
VAVEEENIVVMLSGWRKVWAVKNRVVIPFDSVVRIDHDSAVYTLIQAKIRSSRRTGSRVFRVGAYHGLMGWSFWSCGTGRNAIVIETSGQQYRYVVVEMPDPLRLVRSLRQAAGVTPQQRQAPQKRSTAPTNRRREQPRDQPPQVAPRDDE